MNVACFSLNIFPVYLLSILKYTLTDGLLSDCALQNTVLQHFFHISLRQSILIFFLPFFDAALLRFFHAEPFPCCTFLCSNLFMLHLLYVLLFPRCNFSMLHFLHIAQFSFCIFSRCTLFMYCTVSCCTFIHRNVFLLNCTFCITLFSCCTLFILQRCSRGVARTSSNI